MSRTYHRCNRLAALLACGCIVAVLLCARAQAQVVAGDDVFSDGAASETSDFDGGPAQAGWWHHTPDCPAPCEPGTAGDYCLPGNPTAPVMIENAPGAPTPGPSATCPPPAYAPFPGIPNPYATLPAPADPFIPYAKSGLLQRLQFTSTYLPRNGGGGIGWVDLDGFAVVAVPVPLPGGKSVILLTPDFETHFVDGPDFHDLPNQLYDANLLVQFIDQTPDNVLLYAGIEPGWHSDGQNTTSSADFRTAAYGAIGYRFSPTFAIAIGVGYLDRRDIGVIPLAGLLWVPNPDTRIELIPPKPRIARRICAGEGYDNWLYLGGEMGGGQWAIDDPGGTHDVASYLDYRVLLGVERRSTCGGLGGMAEIGYVFGRRLEFASSGPTYDAPDTVMARLGLIY